MSPQTSPELINVAGLAKALAVHLQGALPVTKRVMNVQDAAEYCGLPRESFKKKVVRDRVPKVRFDKCWRFDRADLDAWIAEYNEKRPHQGRWCFGKTPMQTFLDALPLAKEKLMAA